MEGTLQLNNIRDYSQGQTQAFEIIGNPLQFTLDLKSQVNNLKKPFVSEVNLETYLQRFSQLTVPGDDSLYQLPAEVRQQAAAKLRTVLMREADKGSLNEEMIHKKYSDAIADLLIRFALMEALGRTYVDKDLTASKLRRNGVTYAQNLATNRGRSESEALLLTESEIRKANASFVYYIEQVMGPAVRSIVVPQLHLSPALKQAVDECTGVSYMRADDNIELIHKDGGSVIECIGVMQARTIKLGADYVKLIQRTRQDFTKADLNKRNRNITVEFDRLDENSGSLTATNQIEINGKHYLQVGGEVKSGQGGTFIKMEETIHLKALKTTTVEQGDKLTKEGKNYALKPEFIKAKLITEGHQKIIGGALLFEGVMIAAEKSNHLQAEGDILFKPISATYQGPTYNTRNFFRKQQQTSNP